MGIITTEGKLNYLYEEYGDYRVIRREPHTKVVQRPLPFTTCAAHKGDYLEAYKQYYTHPYGNSFAFLKEEYKEQRPLYTVEVHWNTIEVELTEQGREKVRSRYELHKRQMERYAALMSAD